MKRIFSLTLAAALLMALLGACGNSNSQVSDTPSDPAGESASVPPEDASSPEPSEEPSEEVPTESGRVDLAAFAKTVREGHEFTPQETADPADEELVAVMLENAYPGLKDMDLEQLEVYLPLISFSGVEMTLVQTKNADDAAKVKEIFDARVTAKSTDDDPGNYPAEVELWLHNSAVVSNGNYIMLVAHEDSAAIVSEFNGLFN